MMKTIFKKREAFNGTDEIIEVLEELSAVSWRMAARMKWAKSISEAQAEHQRRHTTAKLNGNKIY